MANIIFPREEGTVGDYAVAHIAEFNFKQGFKAAGKMRRIEWFYCMSGTGHLRLGGIEYQLSAGIIFCSGINEYRELWCNEESLQVIMIGCEGHKVAATMAEAMGGANSVFTPNNGEAIFKTAQTMIASAAAYEPLAMEICSCFLPVLLTIIRQGRYFDQRDEQDNFSTYLQCKRFIDEHYSEIKHVEDIALAVGISHEYMCRLFKRHAQLSPGAYLLRFKMNRAMHTLQHSNMPLKAIAYSQGFASAAAFSKAFKRVMGIAPKFVREQDPEDHY